MSNLEARKRVLHGVKESDLDDFYGALESTKVSDEKTLWQFLTDKDLLPPRGKNLISYRSTLFAATIILNFAGTNPSFAENSQNSKQIEWALEALEKIDPVNILLAEKVKNEVRSETAPFSNFEKQILTWNILYEAGGEKTEAAKLAILLNNLNRMKSKNYPATADAIAFQRYQYSWTRDILSGKNAQDRKDLLKSYLTIRKLVEDNLNSPTLSGNIFNLHRKIELEIKDKFPIESIFYNRADIMPLPITLNPVYDEKRFQALAPDTKDRLMKEADRILKSKNYQIIENHIHY